MLDRQTLESGLSHGSSLNAIRLLLAGAVLFAHSWPLSGAGDPGPSWGGETFGSTAVVGFFAISGYLIAGSRAKYSVVRFCWHRLLRIFPAFWVVLLITAFVLAPISTLTGSGDWSAGPAVRYILKNMTTNQSEVFVAGTLPGVPFIGDRQWAPWNGSAWTLRYELTCYVGACIALSFRAMRRRIIPNGAVFLVATLAALGSHHLPMTWLQLLATLAAPFTAGMLLRSTRQIVPLRSDLMLLGLLLSAASMAVGQFHALGGLPFAYVLLYLAATWQTQFGRHHDLSYGVYIYAWPIQQSLATFGVFLGRPLLFAATTAVLVAPAAAASWFLIERPALRLKDWSPSLSALGDFRTTRRA